MTFNFEARLSSNRLALLADCFVRRGWTASELSRDVCVVLRGEAELVIAFHRRYPGSLSVRGRIVSETALIDEIRQALNDFPFGYQASWINPDGTGTEEIVETMAVMDGSRRYEVEENS